MLKKILLFVVILLIAMVVFAGNCYVTGALLADYPAIGTFLDALFFVAVTLFFIRYRRKWPLWAFAFLLIPHINFSALLLRDFITTNDHIYYNFNMLASVIISFALLALVNVDLKYRAAAGVLLSGIAAFVILPKLEVDKLFSESLVIQSAKINAANARLLNPDSLPVNLKTVVGHGKVLVFSFVGCKPCKDLKKTLSDFCADDSQLKKRLIFITNGRISSFEQFKKYDQYAGISNYYDSAGILSDQYVPESLFPVTCILKENGTVLKYPGFTYTNKNIIYEIIKKN